MPKLLVELLLEKKETMSSMIDPMVSQRDSKLRCLVSVHGMVGNAFRVGYSDQNRNRVGTPTSRELEHPPLISRPPFCLFERNAIKNALQRVLLLCAEQMSSSYRRARLKHWHLPGIPFGLSVS
jgi:hypothetical protein